MTSQTPDDLYEDAMQSLEELGVQADNAVARKDIATIRQIAEMQHRLGNNMFDQAKRNADISAGMLENQKALIEAQRIGNQHLSSIKTHCMVLVLLLIVALIRFW